jgi:hypothetical protein
MQMSLNKLTISILGLLAVLAAPVRSFGITVCHDYVYAVISGGQDANNISPNGNPASSGIYHNGLRKELAARGYLQVNGVLFTLTGASIDSSHLQDGDVLMFGDAHSGVVVDEFGHINHFLQKFGPGQQGVPYALARVPTEYDPILHQNLLRRSWTLDQIRNFQWPAESPEPTLDNPWATGTTAQPFKNIAIQVWRPGVQQLMTNWARLKDSRVGNAVPNTQGLNQNWSADWTLTWMEFEFSRGRTVWVSMAISKTNPSIRLITFLDPDTGKWTAWSLAYRLHLCPLNACSVL